MLALVLMLLTLVEWLVEIVNALVLMLLLLVLISPVMLETFKTLI